MQITLNAKHRSHLFKLGHPSPPAQIEVTSGEYERLRQQWLRTLGYETLPSELHKRVVGQLVWSQYQQQLLDDAKRDTMQWQVVYWLKTIAALLFVLTHIAGLALQHKLSPASSLQLQSVNQTPEEVIGDGWQEEQESEGQGQERQREVLSWPQAVKAWISSFMQELLISLRGY